MCDKDPAGLDAFRKQWDQKHNLLDDENIRHFTVASERRLHSKPNHQIGTLSWFWTRILLILKQDWIFLILLGIIMAVLSHIVDIGIIYLTNTRLYFITDCTTSVALQYFLWVTTSVIIVLFSAGLVHVLSPHSAGSGIPEIKTSIRGVILKEYLTFKTLVAKVIGLICTLGSGMPLGKEGPFVHIASIVAHLLNKVFRLDDNVYENESRKADVLVAASAVGIAACFAAPVGGVFFSIEVTAAYFAVRNYWRGFLASVCSATAYRLFAVWANLTGTVEAPFKTNFTANNPFGPQELFAFALLGIICGVCGAFFTFMLNRYVIFVRANKFFQLCLKTNRFIYPALVSFVIASLLFPPGPGMFINGASMFHDQMADLLSNFTWTKGNLTVVEQDVINRWSTPYTDVLVNVPCYFMFVFIFSIIGSTMPIPCGMFIPVMKIGAGVGRLFGEILHLCFPMGIVYGGMLAPIIPGGYAVVGTAAFAGAVTHTVSIAVIIFEMTGQITHVVPLMVAVLVSKAVASALHTSMYDCMIIIKKLPYLPDLLPSNSRMYSIYVEDFMVKDVQFIWKGMTYKQLRDILNVNKQLKSLPLLEDEKSMILLGSVQRRQLLRAVSKQISRERKLEAASKWLSEMEIRIREDIAQADDMNEADLQQQSSRYNEADLVSLQQYANDVMLPQNAKKRIAGIDANYLRHPRKSILKKAQSGSTDSRNSIIYSQTGSPNRVRSMFDSLFRKSLTEQDVCRTVEGDLEDVRNLGISDSGITASTKRVQLPKERLIDLLPEYYMIWEEEELSKPIDWSACDIHIDPAPFQLVEMTSLPKVHSLFSMLGINHAYVTKIGRLVGVVSVKELRKVIEDINSNTFSPFGHNELIDVQEPLLSRRKIEVVQTAV